MDEEDVDLIDRALAKMMPPKIDTEEKLKELLS